jgi:hypothetical protein
MSLKKLVTGLLLALVAVSIVAVVVRQAGVFSGAAVPAAGSNDDARRRIVVYYFHGNVRCETCLNMEKYADEALKAHFPRELADGRLIFQVINRELPPHEHFVKDYQLYSQALIVVDSIPGKPARWKNLEAIWDHAHDRSAFIDYVRSEVDLYLRPL